MFDLVSCPTCHGLGTLGRAPGGHTPCTTCHGEGLIEDRKPLIKAAILLGVLILSVIAFCVIWGAFFIRLLLEVQ